MVENHDSRRVPVKASDRKPGPYPYYGAQGIVDYVDDYIFDGEFVLVAEDGENLRSRNEPIALMASGKFWVNNHAHILKGNGTADTRFIFYAINQSDISGYVSGSTIPKLSQKNLNAILLPCPEIDEQREIVGVLGALDDKIELNRRTNETLEATARALFKDWFVDFGPTRAKMEARDPYLAPELWALFPERIDEQTGLPKGWEEDTLERLANTNCESWTARNHPQQVEYVDLANTKWGHIESTSLLAWESAPSRARRVAKAGDTIVGTTRPGNGSFSYISREGLTVSTGFAVLSPKKNIYLDAVYLAATSTKNIERLANLADGHGGAYPAVKPNEVSETSFTFPGDEVLIAFSGLVSALREEIEHSKSESLTLAQTRDLLLPKLMSGEIRLRDAEKVAGGVL